tara:strand:- start:72 stop:632 length:561 start_codon:yes stop_codon:yes gene_type:complete
MSAAPSRKRALPLTSGRQKVIRRRLNSESESDYEYFSAGSYPNLHIMYHKYVEDSRASCLVLPFHCPLATSFAKKIGIINKNATYIPKCNNNCLMQKQCKKEAMIKYFHKFVKKKIKDATDKDATDDEFNKEFFVTSLDKIDESDDNHYYPRCCVFRKTSWDKNDEKKLVTLYELSKCIHIKMKYQ